MECAICTGELNNPFTLSCGHVYCKSCIVTWYYAGYGCNKKCPVCKAQIREKLQKTHIDLSIARLPGRSLTINARRAAGSPMSSSTGSITPPLLSTIRDDTRLSVRIAREQGFVEVRESGNRRTSMFFIPAKLVICYWSGYLVLNVMLRLRMRGAESHIYFMLQGGLLYVFFAVCMDMVMYTNAYYSPESPSLTLSD